MLGTVLEAYYDAAEFVETAALFGVTLEHPDNYAPHQARSFWMLAAKQILDNIEQGANYALLTSLLDELEVRNALAVARTSFERREANELLTPRIRELQEAIQSVALPSSIVVPEASPFTAKSEARAVLATATTGVFVVDPYIGVGTLDCFIGVTQPIRLLTGNHANAIESTLPSALTDFRAEGYAIEIRRAPMLHDRHLIFNDRCWLVGSSLKDAGKKGFNCLEIIDKADVVTGLEAKWVTAVPY
jgi:hypothetical protein